MVKRTNLIFSGFVSIVLVLALFGYANFSFFQTQKQGRVLGEGDWYDYDWAYRTAITVQKEEVDADLDDFPVLISSTVADWADTDNDGYVEQPDGGDFVFTTSDNLTKLSHEIEKYDNTTGQLIAWVEADLLDVSDTVINLYYGNAGCADQWDTVGTWDNGFKGVWHMDEASWVGNPNEVVDASGNSHHGVSVNLATTTATAKINRAGIFDGINQYFQVAATSDFNVATGGDFTIEGWFNTSLTGDKFLATTYHSAAIPGSSNLYMEYNQTTGRVMLAARSDTRLINTNAFKSGVYNDGQWHHYAGLIWQSGADKKLQVYVDGQPGDLVTVAGANEVIYNANPYQFGAITVAAIYYPGKLDEFRFANVNRSAGWVTTSFNSQNSPEAFYELGVTEAGDTTPPTNPTTINGYDTAVKANELTDEAWDIYNTPYFEFSGAADPESGIEGYWVYFGTDDAADPVAEGAFQAGTTYTAPSLTIGETYYFRIVTENNATTNNLSAAETLFTYSYDPTAPAAPEYVNVSPVGCSTQTSFTFTWPAGSDAGGSGMDGYQYRRGSTGTIQDISALTVTASSYQEGDNVFYVRSIDNAGSTSSWQTAVYCSTATVQVTDGPTVEAGPSTMTVSWNSNKLTTSYVRVYEGNDYVSEQGQTSYTLVHSVKVVGLEPEKSYRYKLVWTDQNGNLGESDWYNTSTSTAPQINDLEADILGPTSTNISWTDSISALNTIEYGEGAYSTVIATSGYASTGSYKLENLTSGVTYQLRINATSEDGTKFFAGTSFTMPPLPEILSVSYEITDGGIPGAKVSWRTNVPATSSLFYGPKGSSKTEIATSDKINDHTLAVSSLSNSSSYEFYVAGTDEYGNSTQSSVLSFATPADRRPPTISDVIIETSNVGLNKQDKAQIIVSWKTDEPASSYVEYDKGLTGADYKQKTAEEKSMTNSHLVIISDLEPSQPYHLRVASADAGGNKATSEDIAIIAGDVPKSIFQIITNTFENIFGWVGKLI